jgi:hypothetical protein
VKIQIRRTLTALVALVMMAVTVGPAVLAVPSASAATDLGPASPAGYATHWLTSQVTAGGFVAGTGGDPSPGDTMQTALALAAAGHDQATFDSIVAWLSANVDTVTGTGDDVDPGATGMLMLVVAAAHDDATNFGGVNLVTRLGATLGAFEPGLYGSYVTTGDPTYNGVYDQSMSLLGLKASGATEDSGAIAWLVAQQCGGTDEFNGAWMSYRAPAAACTAFDSSSFTGIDTNSTAVAFEALTAVGQAPTFDALAWLSRTQNTDGSFGFYVGNDGDPDSTALVIQAIVAGGQSPDSGRWALPGGNPLGALGAFQLGCDAAVADRGALTFPGGGGAPNQLATEQGAWGLAEAAFPLASPTFTPSPAPCEPTTTTTSAPASTSSTSSAPAAATQAAVAVVETPTLTG